MSLLDETKTPLEKPKHTYVYCWRCESPGCPRHNQSVVDWEIGQAARTWRLQGYDVNQHVRRKWLAEMCAPDRDTMFVVGDQHQRPGGFMVLGTIWPKFTNQLSFDLLAA